MCMHAAVAASLCCALAASVLAADGTGAAAHAVASAATLPPVKHLHRLGVLQVRGNEPLARKIIAAEDDFFRLYNKLNENDDYYISCGRVKVSADLVQRQCGARFTPDYVAIRSYGPGTCTGIVHGCSGVGSAFATTGPSAAIPPAFMARPNTYENNLLKVINSNPMLLQKYYALVGMYERLPLH